MRKILFVLLACLFLCSCSTKEINEISTVEDLDGKNVGFILGTFQDSYVLDKYSNIDFDCTYLNTASELLLSLKTGKIDSIILDGPIGRSLVASNDDVVNYDIPDSGIDAGFIFSDDANDIRNDFNEYLFEAKTSGLIDVLESKWFDNQVDLNSIDIKEYVPTKDTIKVIANVDTPPFSVVKNGNCEGFCLELFYDFAYKYGYGYEIDVASFDAILAGVESGKYDIGVDAISITDERKGNMNFSNPIDAFPISIVVLKPTLHDDTVYTKTNQLEGKKMGCMTGSIFDSIINTNLHASDIAYYNSRSELIVGLQSGKIEGYLADKPTAIAVCAANDSIKYIDESLMDVDYGFCFSKDALNIKEQFNHFLKEANEDGRLNKLQGKWINDDVFEKEMDDYDLTGENGTLKICTSPDAAPFSFLKKNPHLHSGGKIQPIVGVV